MRQFGGTSWACYPNTVPCYRCARGLTARYFCLVGTATPVDCPLGSYCPAGTKWGDQYKCPIGTFGNSTNLVNTTMCTTCTAGQPLSSIVSMRLPVTRSTYVMAARTLSSFRVCVRGSGSSNLLGIRVCDLILASACSSKKMECVGPPTQACAEDTKYHSCRCLEASLPRPSKRCPLRQEILTGRMVSFSFPPSSHCPATWNIAVPRPTVNSLQAATRSELRLAYVANRPAWPRT